MRAQFVLSEIFIGLRRNLTMTIAVIISAAVALGMIGVAGLMYLQVNHMKGYWYDKVEVSIFMCTKDDNTNNCQSKAPTSQAVMDALSHKLSIDPLVQTVYQETQVQAYQNYQSEFADNPIGKFLTPDQMPASLRVKLKDPSPKNIQAIISSYQTTPGIEQVQDQRALLAPLFKLFNGMTVAASVVAFVMVGLALMLIVNTVRLSAFSRRRETGIMRLVGASNLYIRLPFLMEGAIAGLCGVVVAGIGVCGVQYFLVDKVLAQSFIGTGFIGWSQVVLVILVMIPIGLVMSVGASALSLRKYLKV
jgi:cell division transport system permease protein